MVLREKHIDCLHVVDVSVLLEFLSDLRPDLRNGHVQGVHGLDLGALEVHMA